MPSDVLTVFGNAVCVNVKVVPGSSRDRLAGVLGDALKVAVSAPPEAGRANAAVAAVLADVFGLRVPEVVLISSPSRPRKTFRLDSISIESARQRLESALASTGRPGLR